MTDLLTPREAARRIGVAASTVYRWIDRGKLPAVDATPTPDGSQEHDRYGRFTSGGLRVPAEEVERIREERGSLPAWTAVAVGPLLAMLAFAVWAISEGRWYETALVGAAGLVWCVTVRAVLDLETYDEDGPS